MVNVFRRLILWLKAVRHKQVEKRQSQTVRSVAAWLNVLYHGDIGDDEDARYW